MNDSVNQHRTFEILTAEPVRSRRKPRRRSAEEKARLASHLSGFGYRAAAAVVNSVGEVPSCLETAGATLIRFFYAIDPHLQIDHFSAGDTLAELAGAEHLLFAEVDAKFPFCGFDCDKELELGKVPDHSHEYVFLVVTDRTPSLAPWFVLTKHAPVVCDPGLTEIADEDSCVVAKVADYGRDGWEHPAWPEGELAPILPADANQRVRRRDGGHRAHGGAPDRH
ncbi:hypothetical protein [Pseudaminobacter sp. NGMCC 1.201702]|uniref:hypothetical protein n=1 Tax=Pseudaminobacter sp. NGMCC 1.201702 TaxID=3391825 RepID=UPI0039EFCE3A